jgi:hypothetical protein
MRVVPRGRDWTVSARCLHAPDRVQQRLERRKARRRRALAAPRHAAAKLALLRRGLPESPYEVDAVPSIEILLRSQPRAAIDAALPLRPVGHAAVPEPL